MQRVLSNDELVLDGDFALCRLDDIRFTGIACELEPEGVLASEKERRHGYLLFLRKP